MKLTKEDLGNIDKWINTAGIMIQGNLRTNWTDSERATFKKLDQLKREAES